MMRFLRALFLLLCLAQPVEARKTVAITFDDAPRDRGAFLTTEERTDKIITTLRTDRVKQAAFFLNPGYLERPDCKGGEQRIARYTEAGHVIANHSWNHAPLSSVSAEDYLADVDRADNWLKGKTGFRPWYRFPQLDEGRTDHAKRDAVRAGLEARKLFNAQVTADGSDWFLEMLTVDAAKAGKPMDMGALRNLYVAAHMSGLEYADQYARQVYGRSPAHVLLLHETDIAALFLGDLLTEMKRHGWTIITADKAFADPIYQAKPDIADARGTLLNAVGSERGIAPPTWPMWIDPLVMKAIFDRQVLKASASNAAIP